MSVETSEWLNNNTLIGFTANRGQAWHYREASQGDEPNHYVGAIPIEDVRRRLLSWEAQEGTVESTFGDTRIIDPTRKAIIRPAGALGVEDAGGIFGVFKDGYTIHQFDEWLLSNVSNLLDDGLSIGSAGLLKMGAVAWVQVEVPETMSHAGVEYRPHLLATTSHDGSLATTYLRGTTVVVCDNTLSAALGENVTKVRIKHSRNSALKLADARAALDIVHTVGEDFARQLEELTNTTVTDAQWDAFLNTLAPIPDEGRGKTLAENKQTALRLLWNDDERVTPWAGTAFGVVQAVNTYTHHIAPVRGGSRVERNMFRAASGGADKLDAETLDTLRPILAAA